MYSASFKTKLYRHRSFWIHFCRRFCDSWLFQNIFMQKIVVIWKLSASNFIPRMYMVLNILLCVWISSSIVCYLWLSCTAGGYVPWGCWEDHTGDAGSGGLSSSLGWCSKGGENKQTDIFLYQYLYQDVLKVLPPVGVNEIRVEWLRQASPSMIKEFPLLTDSLHK